MTFLLGAKTQYDRDIGPGTVAAEPGVPAGDRRAAKVLGLSRAVGLIGVVAYNWWAVVPFVHGMVTSTAGFFSDFAADGEPHAAILHALDLGSGLLIVAALGLRRLAYPQERRREWPWLVGFGIASAVGGRYAYACPSSLDRVCRARERALALPLHHYVHMAAGVAEFACVTVAIYLAAHPRPPAEPDAVSRLAHRLIWVLLAAYPVIGFAYLQDRWGVFVEPIFFLTFSAIVVIELLAPVKVDADQAMGTYGEAASIQAADVGGTGRFGLDSPGCADARAVGAPPPPWWSECGQQILVPQPAAGPGVASDQP